MPVSRRGFTCGALSGAAVLMTGCQGAAEPAVSRACKPLIAVYPVWKFASHPPETLPWDRFTHLAIASAYPAEDGRLVTDGLEAVAAIVAVAKGKGKKVILSVGGSGEGSQAFVSLTRSPELQATFIENLVTYVKASGFDGVDIDWEYWTFQNAQNKGGNDPEESQRLVALMQALREALPRPLILSVDVFAGSWVGDQYLPELQTHTDYVVLMAYDFTGAWEASPVGHHADLKTFKRALDYVVGRGFAPEKLIVGVPAYGIEFIDGKKKDIRHHDYSDLVAQAHAKKVPLNKGRMGHVFFETPELARAKAQMILERGMAGVMLFEVTADPADEADSLLSAINQVMSVKNCG